MGRSTGWRGALEIRVLGPIEVRVDGAHVDAGGARQRRLLAALVTRAGQVVSSEALCEMVWRDDERPTDATRALRTYVSRLRRALAAGGADPAAIVRTESPGYRLTLEPGQLDAERFERDVAAARSRLERGEPERALGLLDEAVASWRGDPYAELAGEPWADVESGRLAELHAIAVEERAAARLALGAHQEVVAELERCVARDPLRTRPVELLALALFRGDRQAEALRVADRFRRELADVGLEPPPSVVELESRIAASDVGLLAVESRNEELRGYELAERIGEGAFSIVYRGIQPTLGREVAVKQIRSELANRPEFIRRFEAEAHLVASLEHPFIVPLYDFWREPGAAFLVMRWLRGGTLATALLDRQLDLDEAVRMVEQVGSALACAHAAGVIHRDVKSPNVFLDGEGNHYLGDFGIAVEVAAAHDPESLLSAGSPAYASPEQLRRLPVGPATDVHGLGIVLFECLTGHLPFPDERSQAALLQRQLSDPIPSVLDSRPDVPDAVDEVIRRATAKTERERYGSVAELVEDFVAAASGTGRPVPSVSRGSVTVLGDGANPYKGLRAFQESDADDFHGRDRLIDRLVAQLGADGPEGRLVAAVGPSGSGKSSVVRAGLIPRLRTGAIPGSDRWFITTMLPGADPFGELEAALNRVAVAPTAGLAVQMRDDVRGVARAVKSVLPEPDAELLLVLDQFEELFTFVDDDLLRRRFLDGLLAAVSEPRSQLRVVVTIRADFWDRPLRHPELARVLQDSAVTVTPMAADELERAISDPAARVGVALEPGLVSVIIADVGDQPGALPLLQYALTELYDRRAAGLMRLDDYRELGGVAGALARRAEELYAATDAGERAGVRRLFTRLVTPGEGADDTRRRTVRSELGAVPAAVIDRYGAARLLSFDHDPASREPTVEVAHEALIREWPRLRAWVDEDRDGLRVMRHLTAAAADWVTSGRPEHELYRGGRLETAETWAASHPDDLTEVEAAFLAASVEARSAAERAQRARVRRLRSLLAATAVIAVVAIIAGAVAVVQQGRADDEAAVAEAARREAEFQSLAAEAVVLADNDRDLALLLATEAATRWDDPRGTGALLDVLAADDGLLAELPAPASAIEGWMGFLDDRTLVVRTADEVLLYDVPERALISSTPSPGRIGGLLATGTIGGDRFVTIASDGPGLLLRRGETEPTPFAVGPGAISIDLSADGELVVGYATGEVELLTGDDFGQRSSVGRHAYPVTGVVIDSDLGVVVSADSNLNATVWDVGADGITSRWTLTTEGRDRWVDGSSRSVGELMRGASTLELGVIRDAPPEPETDLTGQPLAPVGVELSADGRQVYAGEYGFLLALDAEDGRGLWTARLGSERVHVVRLPSDDFLAGNELVSRDGGVADIDGLPSLAVTAVSPDGSLLAAYSLRGLEIRSLTGDRLLARAVDRGRATYATVAPDGELVATVVNPPRAPDDVALLDVVTGRPVSIDLVPSWWGFSTEGEFYTSGGDEQGERIISYVDPETGSPTVPDVHPEDVGWGSFELGSDGLLYVGDINDEEVRVYDASTDERVATLTDPSMVGSPNGGVYFLDVNDEATLVAVGVGGAIVVWATGTWEPVLVLEAEADEALNQVEFVAESQLLIGDRSRLLEVDVRTGERRVLASGLLPLGGIYHVDPIEVRDDGITVLAGQLGVALYDSETWTQIGSTIPSEALDLGASLSAGGLYAVTGTSEHLLVWNLDPSTWPEVACDAAGRNLTLEEWEQFGPTGEPYRATCPQYPSAVD